MAELVSGVYAEALFHAALELNQLDELRNAYEILMQVVEENPRMLDILSSPTISREEKDAILDTIQFSTSFRNFLSVLLDKRRMNHLPDIKTEFDRLDRKHLGVETAYVSSVRPLTDEQRAALKRNLKESAGLEIEMVETIDPSLIGGLRIQIGDRVMDGSVRHKLQKLLDQMTDAVVSR